MAHRDLVVIGGSAGALEPLGALVAALPADFAGAVLIVIHTSPSAPSLLPEILSRRGSLVAVHATNGARIAPGLVLVAPPDRHLVVHDDRVRLGVGPQENGHRPAIDVLFRSAARWYGPRVVAVALSGVLDDGALGARAVKMRGGLVLVQDPAEAAYDGIPRGVLESAGADHVLAAADLGALLPDLVRGEVDETPPSAPAIDERAQLDDDLGQSNGAAPDGPSSRFTCPDCGGALWELGDAELARYRCRVGHAFSGATLDALQAERVEEALWAACRALGEQAEIAERLAGRARDGGRTREADRYQSRADAARRRAADVFGVIEMAAGRRTEGSP